MNTIDTLKLALDELEKLSHFAMTNFSDADYEAHKESIAALRLAISKAEQAEQQEPVAWLYDWEHEGEIVTGWVTQDFETTKFNNGHNVRPLYASPGRDIEEAIKAERQKISETFWSAVNSCITTDELGVEFMSKFYAVHIFGHWLDRE